MNSSPRRLHTFGGLWFGADAGGRPPAEPAQRHLLLLALAAEAGDRGVSRDRVIGLLWPDSDEEHARRSLNQLRYTMRRDAGADLVVGTQTLRLDPAQVVSDAAEFRAALAQGDVDRAAALYTGPFLDGVIVATSPEVDQWIEDSRLGFRRALEAALGKAARGAGADDSPQLVIGRWRALADLDPLSASHAMSLMRALAQAGDATGALAAAERHESAVRRELEMDPDASVSKLAAEIRVQTRTLRAPGAVAAPTPSDSTAVPAPTLAPPDKQGAERVDRRSPGPEHRPSTAAKRRPLRWLLGAVGILLLLLAGTALSIPPAKRAALLTILRRSDVALVPRRVAVAPLGNRTGDTAFAALGDMAADWIAQGLSETGIFDVVDPRTALVTAKVVEQIPGVLRSGSAAVALGRETGAGIAVGGTYYRDGDSLRAIVRVINTRTGEALRLVPPVAAATQDPGALVSALARLTVAAVASIVDSTSPGLSAAMSPPPSYAAYAATSLAWESFYRNDTADVFRRIRHATSLDNTYAPPILMLAYLCYQLDRWREMDSTLRLIRVRQLRLTPVERAVQQVLEADVKGDLAERLAASREMVRLAPASAEAATLAASSALNLGRYTEALAHLDRVDPSRGLLLFWSVYWTMKANALHGLGRFDEEARVLREGLRQFPGQFGLRMYLARALAAQGLTEAAMDGARDITPGDPFVGYNAATLGLMAGLELGAHGHAARGQALLDSLADQPFSLSADPLHWPRERALRAEILYQAGRWGAADSAIRPLLGSHPDTLALLGRLGTIAARLGRLDEAARQDAALGAMRDPYLHGRHLLWRAHIAAAVGRRNEAVLLLRDAYGQGYAMLDTYDWLPHQDRDFRELLSDPGFLALQQRE